MGTLKSVFLELPLDTNRKTLPSGDLIFCRFSFPLLFVHYKVSSDREWEEISLDLKKKIAKRNKKILVVCKLLLHESWFLKKKEKCKQRKSFEMTKYLKKMMKMFPYYFSSQPPVKKIKDVAFCSNIKIIKLTQAQELWADWNP